MSTKGNISLILGVFALVGFCVAVGMIVATESQPTKVPLIEVPNHLVSKPFLMGDTMISEFRNSQGGTCILALREDYRSSPAIACMRQLPTLDYENLPRPQ